ncbi:MAG: hypothetical protein ACYC0F_00735 [Rhodanobacter sp.]
MQLMQAGVSVGRVGERAMAAPAISGDPDELLAQNTLDIFDAEAMVPGAHHPSRRYRMLLAVVSGWR